MDRSRKRPEPADELPKPGEEIQADKRACSSSSEFRQPGPSPIHPSPPPPPPPPPMSSTEPHDCKAEESSDRSERGGDSHDDSYESDDDPDRGDGTFDKAKFEQILSSLEDGAAPGAQLAGLTELCETLSFSMEDFLPRRLVETSVPHLVRLAGHDSNPDIMLLAVRALTYLCDLMPQSADAIVRHGAVPVLCAPLLAIEFVDVAEQCLQALEKISQMQPIQCLQAGTIMAVLSYVDFFSTSIQRVALSTVANVCTKLPLDCSSLVMEAVPTLCNLLQYEDRKLVETVATCLIRIAESFSQSSMLLDELCKLGVIGCSVRLITMDNRMSLSQATYIGLIGLLTKLSTRSLVAIRTLFQMNISNPLRAILAASGLSQGTPYSPLEDAQSNQVHEVLKLLNQLVPTMARDDEDIQLVLAKEKIIMDQPEVFHQFSADILPVSIQVVNSGANIYVCYGCVSIINSIVYFSTPDMLLSLLKNTNISSFLASLLTRKDHHVLVVTLKIVESLMQKLPDVFSSSFIKEGVIYAIDALMTLENCSLSVAQQSSHIQPSDNQIAPRIVSRCLCYAFGSSPSSSSATKACRLGKDVVPTLAKHIKTAHFTNESMNSDMALTEILRKLQIYCAVLNDNVDRSSTNDGGVQNEEYLSHVLDQVMGEVSGGETMSTFEFIESGIVKSLAHYLSNGMYLQRSLHNCNLQNSFLAVLKRFQTFTCITLSKESQRWEEMLLTLLVRKLQNALSSFDSFPVTLSHISTPRSTCTDYLVRRLTVHPYLKVRFLREEGEANLCEYDDVLSVDLSSSLDVIEGILWPKVSKNNNENQAGSNLIKTDAAAASGSKCAEQESLFSSLLEGLIIEEGELLPVDTSTEPREPMAESTSSLPSTDEGRAEGVTCFASAGNEDARPKLTFSLEGKQLDRSITLCQAILQDRINAEPDIIASPKFLNDVHKVTYKRAEGQKINNSQISYDNSLSSPLSDKLGFSWQKLSFFSSMLLAELPCKLDKSNPSYDILFMLKVLEGLNRFSLHLLSYEKSNAFAEGRIKDFDDLKVVISSVPQSEFMNSKLTDKLEQQLRDPLAITTGSLPAWCIQLMDACPFLFSFEARRKYFRLIACGSSRIMQNQMQHSNISDTNSVDDQRIRSRSLSRKKIRVNRSNILKSAAKMMVSHARSKAVIEVEYDEEVGTGLGPTMEFYTLVSHEFQKVGLGMWRDDRSPSIESGTSKAVGDHVFVVAPFGLFPRPWAVATSVSNGIQFSKVITKFVLLGQLVAKAIKDGRILDIPFSRAFYKVILEQELGIYDIQSFDPELGRTLLEFQALVSKRRYLDSICRKDSMDTSDLCYRNMRIEDLCLDFMLPGYFDYALTSESKSKMVNIINLEEYVSLVVDATIKGGISRQVEAFKSGFNEVFPLKTLQVFTEDELERLLCGEQDTWDSSELRDHIKFDHGYTASSPPVITFLEIIQDFGRDHRRAFLQFVTGSPRLPPGGLAALNPKLTIVRKHCGDEIDKDLPSVMTCANYLKLPPYSSKERMRERLIFAVTEGQGSFHLS